jgi:hypothetical protein
MLFIVDKQNNFYIGLNVHRLNTRNKNQLYIPTENLSTLLTQELGCLIDCPVIFRISGMMECVLRINCIAILLIHFIQLQNF